MGKCHSCCRLFVSKSKGYDPILTPRENMEEYQKYINDTGIYLTKKEYDQLMADRENTIKKELDKAITTDPYKVDDYQQYILDNKEITRDEYNSFMSKLTIQDRERYFQVRMLSIHFAVAEAMKTPPELLTPYQRYILQHREITFNEYMKRRGKKVYEVDN